ncbi:MAG TPA: acetyltransferase [Bacillota bacterium]|nr:acetyltransferase [Bacillota bacterium]
MLKLLCWLEKDFNGEAAMKKIVLIGGGGHCKVIIDLLKEINGYQIVGITEKNSAKKQVLGIPVLGDDLILEELYNKGVNYAFITLGVIDNLLQRKVLFEKVKALGFQFPVLIHPAATVAQSAHIGAGTCLLAGAVVNAAAKIGENVIVNTGAIIEHDCIVGSNVQIAPGAILAGQVEVKDNSFIGMGCKIIQGVVIGENSIIGAGSVVTKSIPANSVAYGVPAVIKRKNRLAMREVDFCV